MHLFIFDLYGKIRNNVMEGVWKANVVEVSPNCPRCGSSNTKFCYYNNYSLTQPRYFCKGCRRYWTKGGSLRNVPVGGGCRKNRRGKSFRILTDRLASKDLAHPNDPDPTGSVLLPESTASSDSKIDLALVYANFLNQKAPEMAEELTCHQFHPSNVQVAANSDGLDSLSCIHDQLPPDSSQLNEENNQILFGVGGGGGGGYIHSIHNHHHHDHDRNYANIICGALPPLPDQEILWPNISQVMMVQNQTFHQTQFPGILHAEASQDPNAAATTGNWSPFDLSCYETFSRP